MITTKPFGRLPSGAEATLYTLTNASGASVSITNYGGIIVKLVAPGANGMADVVLGYDSLAGYLPNVGYLGALIGRVGNRINRGRCAIGGKELTLAANANGHHLHGGDVGFDQKLWGAVAERGVGEDRLILTCVSPDGEEGYPGTLAVKVTYTFTDQNALKIRYEAVSDRDTLCNLTNHAYFNLDGEGSGTVLNHVLQIDADRFTVVDQDCIPTGELRPVDGTPFDLRKGARIGDGLAQTDADEQMRFGKGYDHNFVLNGEGFRKIATLSSAAAGRAMDVYTDMVGVQFYAANMLEGIYAGKCGRKYGPREALCLETQYHPDSINHPNFPDSVLRAGQKYDFTTVYAFRAI
ncbi:MAG: galactose mutarotase [Clostridiales bacterium]|nr:galactose mutarotase [Clostridiales bacterium]